MLNWTIEKCLEMTGRAVQIGEEYQHEADIIRHICQDHPELCSVYLPRIKEIAQTMELLANLSFTIQNCAMRQME